MLGSCVLDVTSHTKAPDICTNSTSLFEILTVVNISAGEQVTPDSLGVFSYFK